MDNLSRVVVISQQYEEGLITYEEWRMKMVDLIMLCSEDEVSALCSLITQYAIHLRIPH